MYAKGQIKQQHKQHGCRKKCTSLAVILCSYIWESGFNLINKNIHDFCFVPNPYIEVIWATHYKQNSFQNFSAWSRFVPFLQMFLLAKITGKTLIYTVMQTMHNLNYC